MKLRITLTFVMLLTTLVMTAQINKTAEIVVLQLSENGDFPNNSKLPVLLYKNVFGETVSPELIEKTFTKKGGNK